MFFHPKSSSSFDMDYIASRRYDLEPYSFTECLAPSLPPLSRKFLFSIKQPSTNLAKTRPDFAQDLIDQLQALDTTIVLKYHESLHFTTILDNIHESGSFELIKAQFDEEIAWLDIFNSLSAQRLSMITAFSHKMDAAIWLELQIATRYGLLETKEEEQAYRDTVFAPYLEYAGHALSVLQSAYFSAIVKGKENPTDEDIAKEMMPFVEEFLEKAKSVAGVYESVW